MVAIIAVIAMLFIQEP
jgi:hypothetical protein